MACSGLKVSGFVYSPLSGIRATDRDGNASQRAIRTSSSKTVQCFFFMV